MRRLTVTNQSDRPRELEVTSYAEIVLAPVADDLAHPAFSKLFVETEYLPESAALVCARRPSARDEARVWAVHVLSVEGRMQGPVEWETDRARFLGRGRSPEDPVALDGRALSGTTGAVLDPIVSLRQRIRLAPGGSVRLSFATGMAVSRDGALAMAHKYHDPSAAARTFALAFTQAQSTLRHLGISSDEAQLFERLASRVLYSDASLRAGPEVLGRNVLGQPGLWAHGISGDLPILLVRVVEGKDFPLVLQILQAQEYWRLKGLSADVVILNVHPVSYVDELHVQLAALLDTGPWGAWKHRPGGVYLLRGDRMSADERSLLASVARVILSGARGKLSEQLDWPYSEPQWQEEQPPPPPRLAPGPGRWRDRDPGAHLRQRHGRIRRRRPRVRGRPRRRPGDAAALGERDGQPRLRHRGLGVGLGVHLGGEQPREPPHALRERPRDRPHLRGALPAGRGRRRGVVAHAGADAADPRRAAGS